MVSVRSILVPLSLLALACAPTYAGPFRPADVTLRKVVDTNPAPDVVEVTLEAKVAEVEYLPGKPTAVWTFDGSVPGPLFEAKVGDRVIVHFTNHLPEATTIHWHGLRVPAAMDGTLSMQQPIEPGATFTYDFTVPDAGLYWYHPHMRSHVQVEKGLYGAFLVRGDDTTGVPERVLVLDDILLDDQGAPLATGSHSEEMMGREGNVPLVNGRVKPALEVQAGAWERWRVVNVSNARYLPLELPGHTFVRVGTDGGLLPTPEESTRVLLTPGERADLLVHYTGAPGSTVRLTAGAHTRGHGVSVPALEFAELRYGPENPVTPESPVSSLRRTLVPLDLSSSQPRELVLTEAMGDGSMGHGGSSMDVVFQINGETFPHITPLVSTVGATETWTVRNDTEMDHPFHLHGFFFEPLDLDGVAIPLQSKDTMNVPAKAALRFAVRYDDRPGSYMFHCHILEHAELGMMGELVINSR